MDYTPDSIQYSKFYGDEFNIVWQPNSAQQSYQIETATFHIELPQILPSMPLLSPILPASVSEIELRHPTIISRTTGENMQYTDQQPEPVGKIQRRQIASIFHSIEAMAQSSAITRQQHFSVVRPQMYMRQQPQQQNYGQLNQIRAYRPKMKVYHGNYNTISKC
jgi:hypothetical protein